MLLRRFVMFAIVGVAGYVVDTAVLLTAVKWLGVNVYFGRVLSYLAAATATWALNARFTFRDSAPGSRWRQWLSFLLANSLGAVLNFSVYAGLVANMVFAREHLPFAVACGSIAGLFANFTLSHTLVFKVPRAS